MFNSEKTFQHLFVIIGLSILTCAVFYTALDSRFLLDDFINLRDLDRIARHGYMEFIFAGISGPGGRPVSLLSFALQHEAWPGNPFAFKLLNLVIHIINGSLIYVISLLICAKLRLSSLQKKLLCFFVTAIWLLHPIQSYTLLYVVQRMTLLSTTFMLLGIGFYLYFRELFSRGREKIALTGMIFSVAIFTAFAILSKENGILLPLYILVIEYTVFSKTINAGNWRPVSLGILLLPLIAFIFYIVFKFDTIMSAYAWREFTPGERLLTETLVLLDYLKNILIPAPHAFSLYHDDYPVSRTVFESMRTAFSVVLIFTFLVIALVLRKRWSIVSFAIFWFFAGHTLESSFIGLELYFEHRNYLPSYGILFLICWLAIKGSQNLISAKTGIAAITCYLVLILAVTVTEVKLWANPYLQALEWKKNHPTSKRALNNLWNIYLVTGQKEKADELRDEMRRLDPGDIYPEIKNIYANYCLDNSPLSVTDWNKMYQFSEIARFRKSNVLSEFNYLLDQITQNKCNNSDNHKIAILIRKLIENPEFARGKDQLNDYLSALALYAGDIGTAISYAKESLKYSSKPDRNIYMIKLLLIGGRNIEAKKEIIKFRNFISMKPRLLVAYSKVLDDLEVQIKQSGNTSD